MKLNEILLKIQETAQHSGLSQPFIVGGSVRDRVRNELKDINDIDITSMNGDCVELAFAAHKKIPSDFQLYDDGHASLKIAHLKIDFSNHFIIPGIEKELLKMGVKDISPLMKEMYSRDFTINTLLQDFNFEKIYDVTGKGVRDIKSGVIRCPINPELTISSDPKRILRALRFALKFDYYLDDELIKAIKKHKTLLQNLSPEYVKDKSNELVKLNSEKAIKMLIEFGLLTIIPMTKLISDTLIKNKLLYYAFE